NFLTIKNLLSDFCEYATFENIIIADLNFSSVIDRVTAYSDKRFFLINSKCSTRSLFLLSIILKSMDRENKILVLGNEHLEPKLKFINFTYLDGYLSMKCDVADLIQSISTVKSGRFYFDHNTDES